VVQLKSLIDNWILIAQRSARERGCARVSGRIHVQDRGRRSGQRAQAKKWIGRIVFGTIGVEVAGTLTHALIASVPATIH